MKTIFENVIKKGGYDLSEMLDKINTYHIEGKLTDTERDELIALARTAPEAQYDYAIEIEKLWAAVRALQKDAPADETPDDSDETESDGIAEWHQPTGAHDSYMIGDKMLYTDGKVYKSLINSNVWSPEVYPNGWELVEEG